MTGCSVDSAQSPQGNSGVSDINSRAPATLRQGGNLNLAISELPRNFNPLHVDADADYIDMAKASYPRAFVLGRDGQPALNTAYFTSVEVDKDDPRVVIYTINPKAVWSDDAPITWQDIAAQAHALSGADPAFHAWLTRGFDQVAAVSRGVDDHQAIVRFKQPYAPWRGLFAGDSVLLPRTMTATPDAFNGHIDKPGPSAGPFVISSIDKADQRIVLTRNPRWWSAAPRLDSITYRLLDQTDPAQLLQHGDVDAIPLWTEWDVAKAALISDIAIRRALEANEVSLVYNGRPGAILADKNVRRVISRAIDREQIADVMLHGLIDNPHPLNNHIFLEGQPGYQNNADAAAYNPAQASRQLDDLGWKLEDGVREKDGKPLALRYVFFGDHDPTAARAPNTTNDPLIRLVQNNLAQIGVKLTINDTPARDFLDTGNFDITDVSGGNTNEMMLLQHDFGTNGPGNYGKIRSDDIDTKIQQAYTELDVNKVPDLANDLDQTLWAEGHSLPLYQNVDVLAARVDLANYGAFGLADIDYTSIGFTN